MLKKLELSVRNSFKYKNANWKQTVNFIVSGGNYSAFLEKDVEPNVMTNTPNANIKNNFTI
jgi:roadblock/LC7 domain-containing protein